MAKRKNSNRPKEEKEVRDEQDESTRVFTRILDIAQLHWGEFFLDISNKLARGLLTTSSFGPCTAELSYDDNKQKLFLVARFNVHNDETLSGSPALLKFQNNTVDLLSRVSIDDECRIASTRAVTVLTLPDPKHAVDSIFSDIFALLENDDFRHLL